MTIKIYEDKYVGSELRDCVNNVVALAKFHKINPGDLDTLKQLRYTEALLKGRLIEQSADNNVKKETLVKFVYWGMEKGDDVPEVLRILLDFTKGDVEVTNKMLKTHVRAVSNLDFAWDLNPENMNVWEVRKCITAVMELRALCFKSLEIADSIQVQEFAYDKERCCGVIGVRQTFKFDPVHTPKYKCIKCECEYEGSLAELMLSVTESLLIKYMGGK